jgi:hypothetical protein
MAIVAFNSAQFKARYPEFIAVADLALSACFDEAGIYLYNTDASPVQDVTRRALLLNMLTAHVASLGGLVDGEVRAVGRVASAGEGSVSVSLDYAPAGTNAWFNQTQYGAAFIQATSAFRGFRYRQCLTTIK